MDSIEQVLPGVWRWADPAGTDRCGTALAAGGEILLVDPPALSAAARATLQGSAGPIRNLVLTNSRLAPLAAPFRDAGVAVWAPTGAGDAALSEGVDHPFSLDARLPGGLLICQLPADAVADGEVAFLWPHAGDGLLITGDALPVIGQVPVFLESDDQSIVAFQAVIRALLAADPGSLAPAHQAPPRRDVAFATAYAARIGSPYHARNAAPVEGPRFLVPAAERALTEALVAPVILRRPVRSSGTASGFKAEGNGGDSISVVGGATSSGVGRGALPRRVASRQGTSPCPTPPTTAVPTDSKLAENGDDALQAAGAEGWIADPFACARCGRPNEPMRQTCGGPEIARLCVQCRTERRQQLPVARLMVCAGGCCTREGARAVLSAARTAVDASGLAAEVDIVPVSCLGECSLGPFLHVADAQNHEPDFARAFREESGVRARRYAADEGEIVDDESELVLSRFAALVQPEEVTSLVRRLARTMPAASRPQVARQEAAGGENAHG